MGIDKSITLNRKEIVWEVSKEKQKPPNIPLHRLELQSTIFWAFSHYMQLPAQGCWSEGFVLVFCGWKSIDEKAVLFFLAKKEMLFGGNKCKRRLEGETKKALEVIGWRVMGY